MSRQQQIVILLKYPELKWIKPKKLPGPFHCSSHNLHWHDDHHYSCILLCDYLICLTPMLDIKFLRTWTVSALTTLSPGPVLGWHRAVPVNGGRKWSIVWVTHFSILEKNRHHLIPEWRTGGLTSFQCPTSHCNKKRTRKQASKLPSINQLRLQLSWKLMHY